MSPSNNSPFLLPPHPPPWGQTSEAQTLNHIFFCIRFLFWLIAPPLKRSLSDHSWAEALSSMPLYPSQLLFLSLGVWTHFSVSLYPGMTVTQCQLHPAVRRGLRGKPRDPSRDLCLSHADHWNRKEGKLSRVTVFRRPSGRCKAHFKKCVFHFSNPYSHRLWTL